MLSHPLDELPSQASYLTSLYINLQSQVVIYLCLSCTRGRGPHHLLALSLQQPVPPPLRPLEPREDSTSCQVPSPELQG